MFQVLANSSQINLIYGFTTPLTWIYLFSIDIFFILNQYLKNLPSNGFFPTAFGRNDKELPAKRWCPLGPAKNVDQFVCFVFQSLCHFFVQYVRKSVQKYFWISIEKSVFFRNPVGNLSEIWLKFFFRNLVGNSSEIRLEIRIMFQY